MGDVSEHPQAIARAHPRPGESAPGGLRLPAPTPAGRSGLVNQQRANHEQFVSNRSQLTAEQRRGGLSLLRLFDYLCDQFRTRPAAEFP